MEEEMEFITHMMLREYVYKCREHYGIPFNESVDKVLKELNLPYTKGNHFVEKKRLSLFRIKYEVV